jgi:hypothetical protein
MFTLSMGYLNNTKKSSYFLLIIWAYKSVSYRDGQNDWKIYTIQFISVCFSGHWYTKTIMKSAKNWQKSFNSVAKICSYNNLHKNNEKVKIHKL